MNQQLDLAKRVSLLFLCLSDEWAYQILRHMTAHGMRKLVGHLNLLKGVSLYDCEAALIDVLEVLLREEEERPTSPASVIQMLRQALPEEELPVLMQEIATDRKEAVRFIKQERSHNLFARHTLDILHGIRSRLLDGLDPMQFQGEHFYSELLNNLLQKIERAPVAVAHHLETALFEVAWESPKKPLDLAGRKKAALAILQLGEEAVERIFQYLAASERQALAFEMICLENIGSHEELLALMDYMELLLNLKLISRDYSDEVQDMLLVLRNDLFAPLEEWSEGDSKEGSDAAEILELFAPQLFDSEEQEMLSNEERPLFVSEEIRERLLQIGLEAVRAHPRLVARAVRYLFKQ